MRSLNSFFLDGTKQINEKHKYTLSFSLLHDNVSVLFVVAPSVVLASDPPMFDDPWRSTFLQWLDRLPRYPRIASGVCLVHSHSLLVEDYQFVKFRQSK
jgi:hypothetical protein